MTQMLNVKHQSPAFGPVPRSRVRPLVRRSLIVTLAAGALVSSAYTPAFAVPDLVSDGMSTEGSVVVGSIISLTGLSADFTLTGDPGDDATDTVEYTVATNNVGGYAVTIVPRAEVFVGTNGEIDTIPMTDLFAGDTTTGANSVAATGPTTVHTQNVRSVNGEGDNLTTDFSMEIPFVESGTYTATLDYVATTL